MNAQDEKAMEELAFALGVMASKLAAREKRMREVAEAMLERANRLEDGWPEDFPCGDADYLKTLAAKLLEGLGKEDAGT